MSGVTVTSTVASLGTYQDGYMCAGQEKNHAQEDFPVRQPVHLRGQGGGGTHMFDVVRSGEEQRVSHEKENTLNGGTYRKSIFSFSFGKNNKRYVPLLRRSATQFLFFFFLQCGNCWEVCRFAPSTQAEVIPFDLRLAIFHNMTLLFIFPPS